MQRQDQKTVSASAREAFGELCPPFKILNQSPPPWCGPCYVVCPACFVMLYVLLVSGEVLICRTVV